MSADVMHDRLRPVTDVCCQLGEAPLWHDGINRLFSFDILGKRLYSYAPERGDVTQWNMPYTASAAGIIDNDHLVLSTERGIEYFSIITGETTLTAKIECDNAKTRSNDGRVGPDGHFYVSTMGWYGEEGLGAIYRASPVAPPVRLLDGLTIPNGMTFAAKTGAFTFSNSATATLYQVDAPSPGLNRHRRVLHDTSGTGHVPDGAVRDAEDHIWVCHWDGGEIVRLDPDGKVVEQVSMPTARPTRACFGGPDLRTLYVTTAVGDLADTPLDDPFAGRLFAFEAKVPGLVEPRYG